MVASAQGNTINNNKKRERERKKRDKKPKYSTNLHNSWLCISGLSHRRIQGLKVSFWQFNKENLYGLPHEFGRCSLGWFQLRCFSFL